MKQNCIMAPEVLTSQITNPNQEDNTTKLSTKQQSNSRTYFPTDWNVSKLQTQVGNILEVPNIHLNLFFK